MESPKLKGEMKEENLTLTDVHKVRKSNGVLYSVRKDRSRYFFPDEWEMFIKEVKNEKHALLFLTLLHTGARIMEALHIRAEDFDFERGTITLRVIKKRSSKKMSSLLRKSRTFFVSSKYLKAVKSYITKNNVTGYLFLDKELPENYENLPNKEKRKYYASKIVSYENILKRKLKKIGIKDWYNFSLHNLRKTYGNWMRIYDIRIEEICYRLGHDLETYMANYGSPLIFTPEEKRKIMNIFGEVK